MIESELVKVYQIVKRYQEGERDFSGVNLNENNLSRIKLSQANLSGASFMVANLTSANLSGCNLTGANFNVARLSNANLSNAILDRATLNVSNLVRADLSEASMIESLLIRGELIQALLSKAKLIQANLNGADLREAKVEQTDFSYANLSGANLSNTNLVKASFVHADLTQANLIQSDWVGADLSGATLTGAKLYNVHRFSLKAEDLKCEWIDLSPHGDHTHVVNFNPETLKKFFNQSLPLVQIFVDAPLDFESNLILMTIYYKLAQVYPVMNRPPSIEVDYRRTTLTFVVEREEHLFPLACMIIFPFDDSSPTQKNIINLMKKIKEENLGKNRKIQILTAMNQVIVKANEFKLLVKESQSDSRSIFFKSATQTLLKNSSQQSLMVHNNANFGKRFDELSSRQTDADLTLNSRQSNLPDFKEVIDFIESFDYLSN
ncbi:MULTISPECIES: pentapeptide repeat-containing protein [Planktothrix]|uniref:Pentapeptide repeat-containing protein n=1 Tax=Planktothrix rubescens CCAP 1459/22 TaxID=329571 RepID=A0A6J7ZNT1_PLARU|nr:MULTISPECIES: pentapeptide repeat-containing protein [Planktothrix]CAC5344401.1 Pentapeptide repeat-containing protein [Planktothrix rubescens NIVA-CYA 18]CAD5916505.1 putative protein in mobD 3'region [Planktothrix rubescens NIVA-CYA 18]